MWYFGFLTSAVALVLAVVLAVRVRVNFSGKKRDGNPLHFLLAGMFVSAFFLFFPIQLEAMESTLPGFFRALLLSVLHVMQVFTVGCEFAVVREGIGSCPEALQTGYLLWAAILFVVAPVFTFSFVLSLFHNVTATVKYLLFYFRETYIFSELNDGSLALASDIKSRNNRAAIVFTDVFTEEGEGSYERTLEARKLGAACFRKDILALDFKKHSPRKSISCFIIGQDETENLNQTIRMIQNCRDRENMRIYVFSTKLESELLLTALDKGKVKVRRINQVQSLINRVLYEQGQLLFDGAAPQPDGTKKITALVVGMGNHGTEMVKALSWFGQMDGYSLAIHGFDRDPLAEEKFTDLAPELMSEKYNGVMVPGEAQYRITIHSGLEVNTVSFSRELDKLEEVTYILVALGDDDVNINTAVKLRMLFERRKCHPVIQAIVYNSQQKQALEGICNYRGQAYDIRFIGDMESSFTEPVIIDSDLEDAALWIHLKWGKEEEFWNYEYNYRSSVASAIHQRARRICHIPGADKLEEKLTDQERKIIESLEHRRWNAYMRSEGYVFSGSKDKASRNDLAKMHHDLVDYGALPPEEKRKNSKVATL